MINFGNKSFSNTAAIAAQAFLIALMLRDVRGGLEFVKASTYRGLLADKDGLNAVFADGYGTINQLPLSEDMFLTDLPTLREQEYAKQRTERCKAKAEEVRKLIEKGNDLDRQLAEVEQQIATVITEHNREHGQHGDEFVDSFAAAFDEFFAQA